MRNFRIISILLILIFLFSCGKKETQIKNNNLSKDYLGKYNYKNFANQERTFQIIKDSADNLFRQDYDANNMLKSNKIKLDKLNDTSIEVFAGKDNIDKISWGLGTDKYIIVKVTEQIVITARNGKNLITSDYALISKGGVQNVNKLE